MWFDPGTNMLVYDEPQAEKAMAHVEGGGHFPGGVYFPSNLYNCQVARAFGLPVVPVVDMEGYDYPIKRGWHAREHQKVMTNFMVLHPKSFNLCDMGTMKTPATLWACDYLMGKFPGTKALIVCPLSIMQRVWGDAIFTHLLGRRTFTIIHGSAERRRELLKQDTDFYIINFDGVGVGAKLDHKGLKLEGLSRDIHDRKDIDIIAIDEASAYRSGNTRRHRIAREVFRGKSYLWPLTGTPTSNGPLDAHGLARLVNNAFGESYTAFKQRVMYNVGGWKWVPKVGAHAEAYRLLQPSIRFEMRDCTDVPPCTEQMRDVELSSEQKKLYDKLRRDLTLALDGGKQLTAAHEAALRLKLIQISCGALYDHDKDVHRVDAGPRISELRAVIEEAPSKIIIFTPLTSVVHMLYNELTDYSRAMINGEIPVKVRDYIFNAFQTAEHPKIIIADPATMSHGTRPVRSFGRGLVWCNRQNGIVLAGKSSHRSTRANSAYNYRTTGGHASRAGDIPENSVEHRYARCHLGDGQRGEREICVLTCTPSEY